MNKLTLLYKILKQPKYMGAFLLGLSGFYLFNALMLNMGNILSFSKQASFRALILYSLTLIKGFSTTMLPAMLLTLILTGILIGIICTLLLYNYQLTTKTKISGLTKIGIFVGAIVPGCATCCGIGLAAILGMGGAFAALPFQGKEVSYGVIGILVISIHRTLTQLNKGCA